ncbi:S1/P1 nuclease [Pseudocolwellia sp. HL-MZ19]|uniref:S1/P1 nuclease n=1 Tax=Pseudocolwellia sp. HL-MZ19 TaxID=3400846 RepID=UPI003CF97D75
MHIRSNNSVIALLAFTLILFSFFTPKTFALGKVGHQVICQLAFDHLPANTQNKVNTLLSGLSNKHKKLINKYNHSSVKSEVTFAESCTWADAIKKDKSFDKYKSWHYLNVDRNETEVTEKTCDKNCITVAIQLHKKILSEPLTNNASQNDSWERLQALMFLGHWFGDIHQPMHINFASDLGGNRTKITMLNPQAKGKEFVKCNNMHWLWDECLLYPMTESKSHDHSNEGLFTVLHDKLNKQWSFAPISEWQKDSVYTWATESLTITRSADLLYCELDSKNACLPIKKQIINLPSTYQDEHQSILETRMLQASARLAYTLENTLN